MNSPLHTAQLDNARKIPANGAPAMQYIGVDTILTLLRAQGVEHFLSGLTACIEADFRRWETFEKSARLASHSKGGVIELMPTSDGTLYAFKYVNGHPANTKAGKLTVTAFGVLADVATGYPLLLAEMTIATGLRTAATSVMAAKLLARKNSHVMTMIGLGAQSEFQALAFRAEMGIRELRVYDIDPAATKKFIDNLRPYDFSVLPMDSVREAVRGADIVTTATAAKTRATILHADMIAPGAHINAIGGDCPGKTEISRDLLEQTKVFVEYPPQSRIEGEIQQLNQDSKVTQIWHVLTGRAPGRISNQDITLFDSVGFAIEDFSTLRYLRDLLAAQAKSHDLDLIPALTNPKNLFGLIAAPV